MPIITLEVMPDSSMAETVPYDSFYPDPQSNNVIDEDMKESEGMRLLMEKTEESTGMHFLVDKNESMEINEQSNDQDVNAGNLNVRTDLLEYTTRSDGSVSCKLCGKVLASRPHWYRHKYRAHAVHSVNPAPLFQCEQCLIYFKSRKGYIGHIASRHSETLQDASPVLTNAQAEALARESQAENQLSTPSENMKSVPVQTDLIHAQIKKEPDPELSIPKTILPTYQNASVRQSTRKPETTNRKNTRSASRENTDDRDKDAKRSREEKMVADIIARVRRECEAQGSGGSTRRGYSRKSALHT